MKAALLRAVGVLLVLGALGLMYARAPDLPPEALVARWAPPPSDFLQAGRQLVHFRDEGPRGDPVPIVLIHGATSSLHTWEGWAAELRERRRVISFDLPGFGLTGPRADGDYRMEADTRFVLEVMDALGVRRAVLAGNSLGGEIAWQAALMAPHRVEALVLVAPAGYPLEGPAVPAGFALAHVPVLNRLFESLLPRALVETGVRFVYEDDSRVTPELVDRYFSLMLREGNRRALVQRLGQATPGSDAERIRSLKVPTLLIWGARDRLIPIDHGRRFERDIAGSRLEVFDGVGHVPHEEAPAPTVALVRTFLRIPPGTQR
jgi:pimeloyl-ACP methyl ester carboxylesterase